MMSSLFCNNDDVIIYTCAGWSTLIHVCILPSMIQVSCSFACFTCIACFAYFTSLTCFSYCSLIVSVSVWCTVGQLGLASSHLPRGIHHSVVHNSSLFQRSCKLLFLSLHLHKLGKVHYFDALTALCSSFCG